MLLITSLNVKFSNGTTKSHIIQRLHVTTHIWESPKPTLNSAEHNETLSHIFTKNKALNKE